MQSNFRIRSSLADMSPAWMPQAALCCVAALAYVFQGLAWPLSPGRDFGSYILYYLDILSPQPVYHMLMLFRTPVTPLVLGVPLSIGGDRLLYLLMLGA